MKHYALDARTAIDHFPGIGRYVSNLARAMVSYLNQDEQLILLRDPTQPSDWQLPQPAKHVRLVDTAVSPFSLSQQWHIPRLLRQLQTDVYHSPYYLMPYWFSLPTVLTIYDVTPQLFPQTVSGKARLLFRLTTRLALHQANHAIAISEATKRDFGRYYDMTKLIVTAVPLAPDPRFQPQPETEIHRIQQQYNLPPKFALYLGINKPHKNLVMLLEAWHKVKTTDTLLVIAGAWDNRYPEVKNRAGQLGLMDSVLFLGPVADVDLPALYSAATIFVFPSRYEGFGLPVIEAMACGTAVACANTSSLPEVGGEAVLYFDPDDTEKMAEQMSRLLTDDGLRQRMAQQSIIQAKHFSWEKTAKQTLAIYRHLA